MQTTLRQGRDVTVDLVKACAILGVAVIHAATGAYQNQLGSAGWYSAVAWGSVSRASVPLFLMCTGVLFLAPEKELSGKKLWLRYILRIGVAMFFWALVYKFYHLAVSWNFTAESITGAVKEALFFQHEDHLYYLHMVLLIYAFLPLLRLLTRHGDKRLLQYALGLWFALGIVYPTVQSYWPFTLLAGVPLQWMLNMSYAAMGYCLLGYYLKKYPLRRRWGALSLGLGLACVFGGTVLSSLRDGALNTKFWEGMSVGVCLMTAGLFSLLASVQGTGPRLGAAARFLSKASFCVYLSHMLFLHVLRALGLDGNWPLPVVGVPLLALLTVLGGLVVYVVASRVPVVKRWLI